MRNQQVDKEVCLKGEGIDEQSSPGSIDVDVQSDINHGGTAIYHLA